MRDVALRALDTARLRGAPTPTCASCSSSRSPSPRACTTSRASWSTSRWASACASSSTATGASRHRTSMNTRRSRPRRRRGREDRQGVVAGRRPEGRHRPAGAPRRAVTARRSSRTPSPCRWRTRSACSCASTRRWLGVPNIVMAESNLYNQREQKTFASSEGAFIEQDLYETGASHRRHRRRRGRGAERAPTPTASAGTRRPRAGSSSSAGTSRPTPGRIAEEASALLTREALPARRHDRDPRRLAGRPADPRELRPRHRARPRARHRGGVRRHQLPHDREARRLPLRLRRRQPDRRRDHPRRPRHLRLRRRGRRGAAARPSCATASSSAT